MEQDILQKLAEINQKVDMISQSVEKTRKLFLITMWVTIAFIVLPLIAAAFVIPSVIDTYTSAYSGLI